MISNELRRQLDEVVVHARASMQSSDGGDPEPFRDEVMLLLHHYQCGLSLERVFRAVLRVAATSDSAALDELTAAPDSPKREDHH